MSELTAEIKKYAVRIKSKDIILGSGVLWKAKLSKKNKLYVFTAAHVIKNCKNIVVEFWHDDRKMEVPAEKIVVSTEYQNKGVWKDVAVIILDYDYQNFQTYRIAKLSGSDKIILNESNLVIIGFPKSGVLKDSFRLSVDTLKCKYQGYDDSIKTIKYKFIESNIDNSDKNEELKGYSGGGIFAQNGSEIVLVGLHKGALGDNAARGNLIGTAADYVRKICQENDINVPEIEEIDGNLSDRKQYFIEEILNELEDDDFDSICEILNGIMDQDMVQIIKGMFCNFCEECNYGSLYHQCVFFRGFLLVLVVFLKTIDEEIDLLLPRIKEMNNVPIYFICSEGKGIKNKDEQTQLKINHFVYALKTERKLSYKLETGCIIVWGSKKQPRDDHRKCSRKEFKKVLKDITGISENKLDITKIISEPQPQVIIHINEIINMLRKGQMEQLHEKFIKYIEELKR